MVLDIGVIDLVIISSCSCLDLCLLLFLHQTWWLHICQIIKLESIFFFSGNKIHSGDIPTPQCNTGTTGETALYNDWGIEWDVGLRLILNEVPFCFWMTRKVSTTCSRNARAGS